MVGEEPEKVADEPITEENSEGEPEPVKKSSPKDACSSCSIVKRRGIVEFVPPAEIKPKKKNLLLWKYRRKRLW